MFTEEIIIRGIKHQWVEDEISGKWLPVVSGGSDPGVPDLTIPPIAQPGRASSIDPTGEGPGGKTFTVADLEAARKQEKDKLYPELQTMRQEI